LKGRDHSEEIDVNGRTILELFMEKLGEGGVVDHIQLVQDRNQSAGSCEHGKRTSKFHKMRGKFLDEHSDY